MNSPINTQQFLHVPRGGLKACARIAAKQDIRYYLNGVLVEADSEGTTLVATDGHRMLIVRHHAANKIDAPTSFIMPREVIAQAVSGIPRALRKLPIMLTPADGDMWSMPLPQLPGSARMEFSPIQGKFPEWRKVIPARVSGMAGHYNPKFTADFALAAEDVAYARSTRGSPITVVQNAEGPAIVRSTLCHADEFLGILMGYKAEATGEWRTPEWAVMPAPDMQLSNGDAA